MDDDYWDRFVKYSPKEFIHLGGGPTWSTGLPRAELLENSVVLLDRDLESPRALDPELRNLTLDGVDIRGTDAKQGRWRFTGNAFETFSYESASPAAADFFDRILDSMCYSTTPSQEMQIEAVPPAEWIDRWWDQSVARYFDLNAMKPLPLKIEVLQIPDRSRNGRSRPKVR